MVSYIGFILPAFILMLAHSFDYSCAHGLPAVLSSAFSGLQAVIVAVVANATLSFGMSSLKNWKSAIIALAVAGLFGLMANPVLIIALAVLLGMLLHGRQPVFGTSGSRQNMTAETLSRTGRLAAGSRIMSCRQRLRR